jgi:hypothetical protein
MAKLELNASEFVSSICLKNYILSGFDSVHYTCFRVRSKYFDRILACLAQTHIKVLFSDGQGIKCFEQVLYT